MISDPGLLARPDIPRHDKSRVSEQRYASPDSPSFLSHHQRQMTELRPANNKGFLCTFMSLWFKVFMLFATPSFATPPEGGNPASKSWQHFANLLYIRHKMGLTGADSTNKLAVEV